MLRKAVFYTLTIGIATCTIGLSCLLPLALGYLAYRLAKRLVGSGED